MSSHNDIWSKYRPDNLYNLSGTHLALAQELESNRLSGYSNSNYYGSSPSERSDSSPATSSGSNWSHCYFGNYTTITRG